jgi:hypothetical protein
MSGVPDARNWRTEQFHGLGAGAVSGTNGRNCLISASTSRVQNIGLADADPCARSETANGEQQTLPER